MSNFGKDAERVIVATIMRPSGETGVQSHFRHFISAARRLGVDVQLVTPFSASSTIVYPLFGPRRIIDQFSTALGVWWYRYWHYLVLKWQLEKSVSRSGTTVVYAQCPLSAKAALDIKRKGFPVEVVLVAHFNISQALEWVGTGRIRNEGWVFRRIVDLEAKVIPSVDRVVFPSRFLMKAVSSRIPAVQNVPGSVIPNFVDANVKFGSNPALAEAISGDLISIGTLEPRKNQEFLLRVLDSARKLGFSYRLTLVGDGPDRAKLETIAEQLGLNGSVVFCGFVPEAARLIGGHRAYVHAARTETFGIALVEALAAGKPVFAPAVGGIPEVFRHGVEGVNWNLDDPYEAAQRLIRVMEDERAYASMSQAAHYRYRSCFSSDVVAPRLLAAVLGRDVGTAGVKGRGDDLMSSFGPSVDTATT